MGDEQWKPIPSYPGYEASSLGRIRHGSLVLATSPNEKGYLRVNTRLNGKLKKAKAHQLVAEAFHGPRPAGLETAHRDSNKNNNRPGNLVYATSKVNASHGKGHIPDRTGHVFVPPRGERHSRSKLTEDAVRHIRKAYASGARNRRELACRFNVHPNTITKVVRGSLWPHVAA